MKTDEILVKQNKFHSPQNIPTEGKILSVELLSAFENYQISKIISTIPCKNQADLKATDTGTLRSSEQMNNIRFLVF